MKDRAIKGGANASPPTALDLSHTVGERVVKLPTASRSKVKQPNRKAAFAARTESPWPGQFIYPGERSMLPLAEAILAAGQDPILREAIERQVEMTCRTVGQQLDLSNALRRLRGEG